MYYAPIYRLLFYSTCFLLHAYQIREVDAALALVRSEKPAIEKVLYCMKANI